EDKTQKFQSESVHPFGRTSLNLTLWTTKIVRLAWVFLHRLKFVQSFAVSTFSGNEPSFAMSPNDLAISSLIDLSRSLIKIGSAEIRSNAICVCGVQIAFI